MISLVNLPNVVYGLECSLCGLLYVGETKGQLNKRMNGHRQKSIVPVIKFYTNISTNLTTPCCP